MLPMREGEERLKMTILRQIFVAVMFVCLMAGNIATGYAGYVYDWRIPQPMTSTDAAIAAIKDMRAFIALDGSYDKIQDFAIDQLGIKIDFSNGANIRRWGLNFNQVTEFERMDDESGRLYSMMFIKPADSFFVAGPGHGRKLTDAVAALAIAQNAPLVPYYDFSIAIGSPGFLESVLQEAKVSAGAVVHSGAPGSSLTYRDVIVEAVYADKTLPITGRESWNTICREAVAGKSEETIVARVIRKGTRLDTPVKLLNYAFGVKISQGAPPTPGNLSKGFGLQVRLLEAEDLKPLGIERSVGFLVLSVARDSSADKMQVREKDVLLSINGVDITSPSQLIELLGKGPVMTIKVWRDRAPVTLQGALTL